MEMPMLTLSEAAKETGLSRSAIFKAIKTGKFSANKDDNGHFQIDPAELFRVYEPVNKEDVSSKRQETAPEAKETAENMVLKAKLETMDELLRQVQSERDDLRRRLDDEAAERRSLTLLLTHQPEPHPETKGKEAPRFLPWLVAGASLFAVAVLVVLFFRS
jgi:predicted DNA-binding protein YlxM (UPF0122 family)